MTENNETIAGYFRISQEDKQFGESQSIENQRKLITAFIAGRHDLSHKNVIEFVDDGYTGLNFDRPAALKMLEMVKRNEIDCIIVKDFSRFSRDYIEAGDYLERIFPYLGIRFISINDGYDSCIHGSLAGDIGNSFKNLYNSYYSKDLSRKIRSGTLAKKQSGIHTPSHCPYGYKKPSVSNGGIGMILDDEAAVVVKRIFAMRAEGKTLLEIVNALNEEHIPSPMAQQRLKGGKHNNGVKSGNTQWSQNGIRIILADIRYAGYFAYNMYKSDRIGGRASTRLHPDEWTLVPDAIPAIITLDEYKKVQPVHKQPTRKSQRKSKKALDYFIPESCITINTTKQSGMDQKKVSEIRRQIHRAENNKTDLYDRYCDESITRDEFIKLRDKEDEAILKLKVKLHALEHCEIAT